jgi:competence protein ComEC
LFFQGIGASGFARGGIKVIASPHAEGPLARADAFVQRMRDAIDARRDCRDAYQRPARYDRNECL